MSWTQTFKPRVVKLWLAIALGVLMMVPASIFGKHLLSGTVLLQASAAPIVLAIAVFARIVVLKLSRDLKSGISVSEQGLWPAHSSPESSLIPWQRVARAREHKGTQTLELLDSNGHVLLEVSQDLKDFDQLQEILARRLAENQKEAELPVHLREKMHEFLGRFVIPTILLGPFGFGLFALLFGRISGYFGMAAFILCGWFSLSRPIGLGIERNNLSVKRLFSTRCVFREDVDSVIYSRPPGNRPRVTLKLKDGATFHLQFSSIETLDLKVLLDSWLKT